MPDPVYLDTPDFDSSDEWQIARPRREPWKRHARRSERYDRWCDYGRPTRPRDPWHCDDDDVETDTPTAAIVWQTININARY